MELILYEAYGVRGRVPDPPVLRAKGRVIVTFSEGLRYLCVETEVAERMEQGLESAMLQVYLWKRMKSWQVVCDLLLELRRTAALPDDHPLRHLLGRLAVLLEQYNYANLEEIAGAHGDLRLILRRDRLLVLTCHACGGSCPAAAGSQFSRAWFPPEPNTVTVRDRYSDILLRYSFVVVLRLVLMHHLANRGP